MSAWARACITGLVLLLAGAAAAQDTTDPTAQVDRDRIRIGETVNLTLAADRLVSGAPDVGGLAADFDVLGRSGRTERVGGRSTSVWTFTLRPRVEGVLGIASIDWAGGRTRPLSITVLPAERGSADAGDPVYLEAELDDRSPYVQQALVFTIRLGYRVALLEGRLEAPSVDHASLRQVGDDVSYQRDAGGHTYRVIERRYVIVPERSGTLDLGPARFLGRIQGSGGIYGAFESVAEASDPIEITVRPRPAGAAAPWVPARDVAIEMDSPPARARLGDPVTLTLRVRAEGVLGSQLPELMLPDGDGYQVYPEAADVSEFVEGGVLVVEGLRRFVVVPLSGDRLEIPPSSLEWWDVDADQAARAPVPGLSLELLAARTDSPGGSSSVVGEPGAAEVESGADAARPGNPWMWLSLVLALGWTGSTVWLLRRGSHASRSSEPAHSDAAAAHRRGGAAARLRRALAEGDLAAIADALVRAAPVPATGLCAVSEQLAEGGQVEAINALQSARWHQGDPAAAREQLRRAFAHGPQWRERTDVPQRRPVDPLPPLYPPRGT